MSVAGDATLAAAIDALVPLLGPPDSEPVLLEGGITNRNYRMRWGGRDCVLRLPGKETALLGIDRATERDATRAAAGIGPDVIAFDPRHECLVTSFIDGRPVEARGAARAAARRGRGRAALDPRRAGGCTYAFSPWQRVARYRATAVRRRMPLAAGVRRGLGRGRADLRGARAHGRPRRATTTC